MAPNIILVDENDNITGRCEKLSAHQCGKLHRAFSIFILNSKNELLIQQRAFQKYHSGGLWSNTCCSHFTSGKNLRKQANKRLIEEMQIHSSLKWIFNYRYSVLFENSLKENELVYAYLGFSNENPVPDPKEINDWKWIDIDSLKEDMISFANKYSFWFKYSFDDFIKSINAYLNNPF